MDLRNFAGFKIRRRNTIARWHGSASGTMPCRQRCGRSEKPRANRNRRHSPVGRSLAPATMRRSAGGCRPMCERRHATLEHGPWHRGTPGPEGSSHDDVFDTSSSQWKEIHRRLDRSDTRAPRNSGTCVLRPFSRADRVDHPFWVYSTHLVLFAVNWPNMVNPAERLTKVPWLSRVGRIGEHRRYSRNDGLM